MPRSFNFNGGYTMANYESPRYPALGFYVDGVYRRFSGGQYSTDEPAEIAVLDVLVDVTRNDKEPQEIEAKPEVKATPAPRKPSAKVVANTSTK